MDQNESANILEETDIHEIFKIWERSHINDPELIIRRLAELFEMETTKYMLKDPDPFDERHPSPTSELGKNLKFLFKKENFMNRLVNDYLRDNFFTRQNIDRSSFQLNVSACRLILIIMPGLETSAVFQVSNNHLINKLYEWVESAEEPLKSYATGLLGAAMDIQEIAVAYREQNIRMLPLLLQRLKTLQLEEEEANSANTDNAASNSTDHSSSIERQTITLYPPTLTTRQMLILHYLTPMGEYQEFLPYIFEHNAMDIIFKFLKSEHQKRTNIMFEALKYLASLLCHKKCCLDFLNQNGLQKILTLPRVSTIATGTAIALYYIAYCEEAMERICSMSPKLISELINYVLGLLACVHDSGRCHATMFLGYCFQFKILLDDFDKQDGLRQLYNVISVLPVLEQMAEDYNLTADEENAQRQVVRHVCVALKKYFESHLFFKYTLVSRSYGSGIFPMRALKNSTEVVNDQIMNLQNLLPIKSSWQPVNVFLQLGGVKLLILVVAHSYEWNYSGRAETVRSALDVLNICCVMPKVHAVLCERIEFPEEGNAAGINIVLGAAEGEIVADPDVQKSALSLLVNCICAPLQRVSGSVARFGSAKKKIADKNSEELIQKVWETVRSNNGIIVLLQLITTKTPITDADCLRGMACRALAGLARSETVRQIISKLPIFVSGQLQQLMRDPILQEKRAEHVQFQKYALELIERISGKAINVDTSLANIHKANVVAQTKIQFNEKQLLFLIHRHLVENGLVASANSLLREGKLDNLSIPNLKSTPSDSMLMNYRSPVIQRLKINKRTQNDSLNNISFNETLEIERTPQAIKDLEKNDILTPIKLIKKQANNLQSPQQQQSTSSSLEKQPTSTIFISNHKNAPSASSPVPTCVSLNTIVTEYLTNQHSLCKNPMATCPTFDLFKPHKCPDPRPNRSPHGSINIVSRFFKKHQGYSSLKLDRRFVHSNFNVSRSLRINDVDSCFTACDFYTPEENCIVTGTQHGEIRILHMNDSNEDFSASSSDTYINNIQCSRNGELILTSSTWHSPLSMLWSVHEKQLSTKLSLDEEEHVEFSNLVQDKLIGTKREKATIYDLHTGQVVRKLNPTIFNQYSKNHATFCPLDELVLSDGVLWDHRAEQQIHKFDKLNNTISGVFHPNGLEIISNTEVWDLRTFHLIRTVPLLDQHQLKFSPLNVIFAYSIQSDTHDDEQVFDSSFKILDSSDYSSIATIDVRKSIYDLAINHNGYQIAICENQGGYESVSESVVKVYATGRKRDPEDDGAGDEEEMGSEEEAMDSGSDNDEFEPLNRRRNRNLNRGDLQLEDMLNDVISLSTESDDDLSDEAMFESDNEEEDLNSDELQNENEENDSDSQWSTEDEWNN